MALEETNIIPLGSKAPSFFLEDTISGNYLSLDDLASDKATVIMFICNHCPYVIHINPQLVSIANMYRNQGVSFIAISSNDIKSYPEDGPEYMKIVAKVLKFPFPYLFDKRQEVARAYDAICTPDIYVFNSKLELSYRGRIDESRPGSGIPVTGSELRNALDKILENKPVDVQHPSIGCSIKWK